jgi:hypothetical protein
MKELKHTNLKEKYASLEPSNVEDNKIDYEYSMETTKLIADWIASCPVNFVNVIVPENDEVQLTLSRTRKK